MFFYMFLYFSWAPLAAFRIHHPPMGPMGPMAVRQAAIAQAATGQTGDPGVGGDSRTGTQGIDEDFWRMDRGEWW